MVPAHCQSSGLAAGRATPCHGIPTQDSRSDGGRRSSIALPATALPTPFLNTPFVVGEDLPAAVSGERPISSLAHASTKPRLFVRTSSPPCRRGDYHSSDGGEYVRVEQAGLRVERLHPVFSWFGLCVLLRAPKPIDKGRVTGHITRTRDSSMVSPADLAGGSAVPDIYNMVILRYLGEASEYGYRTYLGKGRLLRAVS